MRAFHRREDPCDTCRDEGVHEATRASWGDREHGGHLLCGHDWAALDIRGLRIRAIGCEECLAKLPHVSKLSRPQRRRGLRVPAWSAPAK